MSDDLSFKADLDLPPGQTLGDVPGRQIAGVEVSAVAGRTVDGVQFGIQAGSDVTVRVFNSLDDEDPAGVLGVDDGTRDDALPAPQIELDTSFAWLCYGFELQIKGTVNQRLEQMGLSVEGEKSLTHLDYRRHDRQTFAVDAVFGDLTAPRVIARWADIEALEPGDGLAYQLRGGLSVGLELSASDLATGTLSGLGQWVHTDVPVVFEVSSGASISADVGWTDDFTLAITRESVGRLRLAVHKTKARKIGVSAKLGAVVELRDSEALAELIENTVDRLIGDAGREVERLLESSIQELQGNQDKWQRLLKVARRLGFSTHQLEKSGETLESVAREWQAFKKKVDDGLRQAVKSKIKTAFTYDYQRIRESTAVLQAVMPDHVLGRRLQDLLRARLGSTVDWLRRHPDSVERFMRRDRVERAQTWGFSLTLGSSFSLSSRSSKRLEKTVRQDLQGREQISFLGDRGYEGQMGEDAVGWRVDFKAQMPEYSRQGPPHGADATEVELGLAMSWRRQERRARHKDIDGLLDQGVLWGFLDEDDLDDISQELKVAVGKNRKGFVAEIGLQLGHEAFLLAAKAIAESDGDLPAAALAGAMPYWETFEARTLAKRRIRLYRSLWKSFLAQDEFQRRNTTRAQLGGQAQSVLRGLDGGKKIADPEAALATENNLTFAAQAKNHPTATEDWQDFAQAMGQISRIFSTRNAVRRESAEIYGRLFGSLRKFWDQALYLRALGALLAQTVPVDQLSPSLWVEIKGEDRRRIFLGSKQTA